VPGHALGLDDQILKDFVETGAEMNFAGGVVVHRAKRRGLALRISRMRSRCLLMPGFELLRLVLREASLHREIVFGKFSVFFSSSGSAMIGALVIPSMRPCYRCTPGNNAKQCKDVCYMDDSRCQPLETRNLSRPAESYRLDTESGNLRLK